MGRRCGGPVGNGRLTANPPGRLGHCGIAGVRFRPEPAGELPILGLIQARRLPDERGPPLLSDLLREPLERLPGIRGRRQHPDRIVEQQGPEAAQPAPDAEAEAAGGAGKTGGEEDPAGRGPLFQEQ